MNYNQKDIFLERRTANQTFEEYPLHVQPNSVVVSDINGNLAMVTTSSFIAGTGSIDFAVSSSVAATASYLIGASDTASYAKTSSVSIDATSASYAKIASVATSVHLDNTYITVNTASNEPPQLEGQIWWDKVSHTYAIDELESRLQIGQENYIRAIAGEFIPNGGAVYLLGSATDPDDPLTKLPIAYLAIADGIGDKSDVVGVSTQELAMGARGFITTQGIVNDLDTSTFFDGDTLYLSPTNSGSYVNFIPDNPAEKIKIGTNLYTNAAVGRILVSISSNPLLTAPFVGITKMPTISIVNFTASIGTGSVNLCTSPDGLGIVSNFQLQSASLYLDPGLFNTQFIVATYNSGSPAYRLDSDRTLVDSIQTTFVYTINPGVTLPSSYVGYDTPGNLLANKLLSRIGWTHGLERGYGLALDVSASFYAIISSGSVWNGANQVFIPPFDSSTGTFGLMAHSASVWTATAITQLTNTVCDDGTNVVPLGSGANHWVVNYVYRSISNNNSTLVLYSKDYSSLTDAQVGQPPPAPQGLYDVSILVGRVIYKKNVSTPVQIDSAFVVNFTPSGIVVHNDLTGLQGGFPGEYYHLDSASFAQIQEGSLDTASYLNPGATLYVVSASASYPSSYIEPFNIPVVPYNPPYKEGRMFYDKDYSNWVYYTDQPFKLHIGKEVIWRVHNPFTQSLPVLTAVYLSGSTNGQDPDVYPAIADGTGLHNNAVGILRHDIPSGSTGYVLQTGVAHNVDMTGFNIGDNIWLSNTVPGGFINARPGQPYETVHLGFCQVAGTNGSIIIDVTIEPVPSDAYAGVTSPISIQNNNDGTITVSTGSVNLYDDSTGFGAVIGYPLESKTFTLVTGSTNYVVVEHSASLASYALTTDTSYANGISIVRVATLDIYTGNPTGSEWDVHVFDVGIVGLALANRSNNKDISLYGYQRQDGLTLFEGETSGSFEITEGTIWYGPNSHAIPLFNSTASGVDVYHFVSSGSGLGQVWTRHTQSIYDNGNYNDVGGITPLSPNSWSVNFIYRLVGASEDSGYDDVALVLSSQQFTTELEASSNATTQPNLPGTIRDASILIGRIIVQSGSFTPTIESAFSNIFVPAVVTNHESLLGLQGGQGGEHYHLTLADYTGTGTGLMVRQFKPTCSLIRHLGATAGHVPYWTDEQTLTYTGSFQVIGGQYITINSASSGDPLNPEALLVKQVNTESVNTIGAYADVNNYSQIYNQNQSSGSSASTDIVATNDTGSQTNHYIDMGVASSGYNDPRWPWLNPNDSYVEVDGGDLWLATLTDNTIRFVFNNTASTNYADKTGFYLSGSFFGTASYAEGSVSSSHAVIADNVTSASYALSASYAGNVPTTASYALQALSASMAASASVALQANVYAGLITDINVVDNNDGTVTISTASVNLFSDFDGNSIVQTYFLQSASFAVNSGSAQYIVANYNGGSPEYQITTDPSTINETTIVPASVLSNIRGEIRGYTFDNVGSALANRLDNRLSKTEKFARQNGLMLFNTGSGFMAVTAGNLWNGATQITVNDFNSMFWQNTNPVVNENYFYHHTSSLPPDQFAIEESASIWNHWMTDFYDDGTDLVPMSASYYVVNYIWRLVGGISPDEDMSSIVGLQYATVNEAKAEAVPTAPTDITELGILVGRAICQSGSAIPVLIESAFATTFQASSVTNHENLDGLEGGTVSQHYHLTNAEYTGTGTGVFVRKSGGNLTASLQGTASVSLSSSVAVSASFAVSASWTPDIEANNVEFATQSLFSTQSLFASQSLIAASASWASSSISASNSTTASYAFGVPTIKSGIVAGTAFSGSPSSASITFTKPFADNNYSVVVTGESARSWTIQNKSSGSFEICSNDSFSPFTNNVFWQAVVAGEFYS